MLRGLYWAALVLGFDQLSKWLMMDVVLKETPFIEVLPVFNLVTAWNTGISFSMFNDGGIYGVIGLSLLALVIVGILLFWLYNETNTLLQIFIGFIIGGAIGNVIDRIRFGAVFDFLDFHWGESHWPAFNMADSFICIGAVLMLLSGFFEKNKTEKKI